ncbi:MAG: 7-cyano-7-deazaguanine synthase QueC [Thermotogae bacterium]|nr:7-cyano-7-deazaguanine synthase QueC [Thermotogota bacterium]
MENDKCVVLLSGGIDSATALWWALERFKEVHALTFTYGQRHALEVEYARRLAEMAGVAEHRVIDLSILKDIGGSALTDESMDVPEGEYPPRGTISTYVPMRNSLFGVVAGAYMEVKGITDIVLGVHASDVPNYPDTRPEWASALEALLNAGSSLAFDGKRRIKVHTPFVGMRKADIIRLGLKLGVPYEWTWSCYSPKDGWPCGRCPTCVQRAEAFRELGLPDPLLLRLEKEKKEVET